MYYLITLTINRITKMKKYSHVALGLFIAEQFKKAGVKIAPMCTEISLGKAIYYAKVIKGETFV